MNIEYNGFIAKLRKFDNDYALKVTDLIAMSGQNFTQFYRRLKQNFKYDKYIRRTNRKDTCLTLDGCIVMLESLREPNDGLIKKIKDFINENQTEERGITCDFNKMFPSNEERIKKLENDVFCIDAKLIDVVDRLIYIENNPTHQEKSINEQVDEIKEKTENNDIKYLLKCLLKEIIKEELTK